MGFYLYLDYKNKILEIGKLEKANLHVKTAPDEITYFNDFYFICNDKKKLKDKANEIKNTWIERAEKELNELKGIKVKNKY